MLSKISVIVTAALLGVSGAVVAQEESFCGTPEGFQPVISPIDTTHALAIFCCFPEDTFDTAQGGELPQAMHAELPDWYDVLLDSTTEGSASHFYVKQCYGRHILTGESRARPVGPDSARRMGPGLDIGHLFTKPLIYITLSSTVYVGFYRYPLPLYPSFAP